MDYFEYQWIQRRLIDDKEALESLPEKLEADVAIKVSTTVAAPISCRSRDLLLFICSFLQ